MVANARAEYARGLAERFLCSPARFLLDEADAAGIARLEAQLVGELDAALRFSARVWSRDSPLAFFSLRNLTGQPKADMTQLFLTLQGESLDFAGPHEVAVVLQPAVGVRSKSGGPGNVWVKAQVAVARGEGGPVPVLRPVSSEDE